MIPFLSRKRLSEFTPTEYKDYVKSLYQAPVVKAPKVKADFAIRKDKRGITFSMTRKPKWVTFDELFVMSKKHELNYQELIAAAKKRKIEVRR